jgi:hypothetical protein
VTGGGGTASAGDLFAVSGTFMLASTPPVIVIS